MKKTLLISCALILALVAVGCDSGGGEPLRPLSGQGGPAGTKKGGDAPQAPAATPGEAK